MKRTLSTLVLCLSFAAAQNIQVVPEPKQVTAGEGAFTVGASTPIVLNAKHAKDDRLAAEMLAEEIERWTGKKPTITTAALLPATRAIYLARWSDDAAIHAPLKSAKLDVAADFNDEGYVLSATARRIIVSARTGAGLFYGVQTLRQLIRPAEKGFAVASVSIRDWPTMKWRGLHDDISRGPVPNLEYAKQQIRTCAEYKLNLFSLYIEHTFDYEKHPLIGPKGGALTKEQVKDLVAYAARYHVTLLPEQQAFGHLHHVLKHEKYSPLAETPHGHVLSPVNEGSYKLIADLYSELIPLFPGPLFHIGGDETWELGTGQTKARADQVGLGRVYLEHLQRVHEIVKPYGKQLMFWHDIAIDYRELLDILPKDMIAVPWNYSDRPSFEPIIKPFRDAGFNVIVSPGANNWNTIWPNLDVAFVNIRNFVRDGQKNGALGMLNTTWDDDGEALFGMTWPAVVFGAECSWQEGECNIDRFLDKYDWSFYRSTDHTFRDAIKNLNRTHALLKQAGVGAANDDGFWSDPFTERGAIYVTRVLPVARDLRLSAESALEAVYIARRGPKKFLHDDSLDYLIFAGKRLDGLGLKVQLGAEISQTYWNVYQATDRRRGGRVLGDISGINGKLQDLRDLATDLRADYSALWLRENRPYWLGNVQVRYDKMAQSVLGSIDAIRSARQTGGALAEPVKFGFFIKPDGTLEGITLPTPPAPGAQPPSAVAPTPPPPQPPSQAPAPQPRPPQP